MIEQVATPKKDLKISKQQVWTSSIVGVGGTILMRFIMGPLCDKYGARVLFMLILCLASIPTACTGLIQDATGLAVLRLFIGLAGATFVPCQYWASRMFTKEVVGTANALVKPFIRFLFYRKKFNISKFYALIGGT